MKTNLKIISKFKVLQTFLEVATPNKAIPIGYYIYF